MHPKIFLLYSKSRFPVQRYFRASILVKALRHVYNNEVRKYSQTQNRETPTRGGRSMLSQGTNTHSRAGQTIVQWWNKAETDTLYKKMQLVLKVNLNTVVKSWVLFCRFFLLLVITSISVLHGATWHSFKERSYCTKKVDHVFFLLKSICLH